MGASSSQPDDTISPKSPVLRVLGIFGQHDDHPDYWSANTEGMLRYRLQVTDPDGEGYEVAHFRPQVGLIWRDGETGEEAPHDFWHNQATATLSDAERADRAVLFQSLENYESMATSKDMAAYFQLSDRKVVPGAPLAAEDRDLLLQRVLERPTFGEQIIVTGATPRDVAVGDIFEVSEGSSLRVQVTSPRKPCYWLDRKNKTPMGEKGAKAFTQSQGLAGWFAKVLVAGDLKDGMELVRTHHPHPEWTLREVSQALFGGEGDPAAKRKGQASWGRSREELLTLMEVEALAAYEWKNEMEKLTETAAFAKDDAAAKSSCFGLNLSIFDDVLNLCTSSRVLGCLPSFSGGDGASIVAY